MKLVGIDVGKLEHTFCVVDKETNEILIKPRKFKNNFEGFKSLFKDLSSDSKQDFLIGMEDTGHYHFNLLKHLLDNGFTVALINPVATDMQRKMYGGSSKTDNLDTLTICDVIASNQRHKSYRISKVNSFALYEQKLLTREHHDLKESLNTLKNKLQKSIDIVFPEYNDLFQSKYGKVYMEVLKTFGSAKEISTTDIRKLRKCFETGRGNKISLTAEKLKEAAKNSIGMPSTSEVIRIKHLIGQIELIQEQIDEVDKKIEEYSIQTNSPILTIPGISHFSGTSILAELGDIHNYTKPSQIIKFAGMAPYIHESSQYEAKHTAITKRGSRYLRKTLYQIILPVIQHNQVFKEYYQLKLAQGKGHRCAQGHCVRKLLRVIFHLLSTGQEYNPDLLR